MWAKLWFQLVARRPLIPEEQLNARDRLRLRVAGATVATLLALGLVEYLLGR